MDKREKLYTLVIKLGGHRYLKDKSKMDMGWDMWEDKISTIMETQEISFEDALEESFYCITPDYFLIQCELDYNKKLYKELVKKNEELETEIDKFPEHYAKIKNQLIEIENKIKTLDNINKQ